MRVDRSAMTTSLSPPWSLPSSLLKPPWPVLPPPVKFAGHATPPTDSLDARDHKLVSSIHDQVLGAAELHPDGNRGSCGLRSASHFSHHVHDIHGVLAFRMLVAVTGVRGAAAAVADVRPWVDRGGGATWSRTTVGATTAYGHLGRRWGVGATGWNRI
nr:unnamed protein product [Digitaria exilis]